MMQATDRLEGASTLACHDARQSVETSAHHARGRFVHAREHRRVAVVEELGTAGLGVEYAIDVTTGVEALDLGATGTRRCHDRHVFVQTARIGLSEERALSVLAQGMAVGKPVAAQRLAAVQADSPAHAPSRSWPRLGGARRSPLRRGGCAENLSQKAPPRVRCTRCVNRAMYHSSSTTGSWSGFSSAQAGHRTLSITAGEHSNACTISRARTRSRSSDTQTSGQASVNGNWPRPPCAFSLKTCAWIPAWISSPRRMCASGRLAAR